MPKIMKTIGSGMTERAVRGFDWADAGEAREMIRAAVETFERSSFDRLSSKLEALATGILEAADLSFDPGKVDFDDGRWVEVEDDIKLGPEIEPMSFADAYTLFELAPDSPEGYAVQMLMLLQRARQSRDAGSVDEAMALASAVGELANEAGMKDLFEADFIIGRKLRAVGHQAHEKVHGTSEEKAARRDAYLLEYDRLRADGMRKTLAYDLTAEKFSVSAKTIQRAVMRRCSDK